MSVAAFADFGVAPVVATDIDGWLIDTVAKWLETYLRQTERERGEQVGEYLGRPRRADIGSVLTSDEFLDGHLPTVLLTTAPTEGTPVKHNSTRTYEAAFRVTCSCIVRGRLAPAETRRNAAWTEGTLRRLLLQQPVREDNPIIRMGWLGSNVAPLTGQSREGRWLAAGITQLKATVDQVVGGEGYGPAEPDLETYEPFGPVTDVQMDFDFDGEDSQ